MEPDAKQAAVRLLARREHSEAEIRHKLRQRDFPDDEIARALVALREGGWQSDERFAEAYIRSRRLKGFGPLRIAAELGERGIDEVIVSRYLDDDDETWLDTLRGVYEKKYHGTVYRDYQDKAKRMRFLQYRGFPPEMIRRLVK